MILIMNIITPRTASNEVHDLSASVRPIPGPLAEVEEISLMVGRYWQRKASRRKHHDQNDQATTHEKRLERVREFLNSPRLTRLTNPIEKRHSKVVGSECRFMNVIGARARTL
jgi:hypothetical protein